MPDSVSCKCVMYADDTTLLCSSSDPVTLQQELDKNVSNINKWFHDNKLSLNAKKTNLMVFGTNYILSKFDGISLSHENSVFEKVDSFKYLGVTLDPNLTWYVRHGWRFDPGFTAKSVKKIFRGENEHWEFLDISFLG